MSDGTPQRREQHRRWMRALLAFALVNSALAFENRWPGLGIAWAPRLSFDWIVLVAGLAAAGAIGWQPGRRGVAVLGALLPAALLLHYLDITAPAVFGRPISIVWDGRHGVELLRLSAETQGAWLVGGSALLALATLGVAAWGLARFARWGLRSVLDGLALPGARPLAISGGLVAILAWLAWSPDGADTRYYFSRAVAPTVWREVLLVAEALWPGAGDAAVPAGPDFAAHDLAGLRGADVLLLFAESYGVTTLDRPEQAAALQPAREAFALAIASSGRQVVSARVRSPTYGGGSWLAHAALLYGVDTAPPGRYERLLASGRPTLLAPFSARGWRTVGWMPGLQKPWPEGAAYGYERLARYDEIGYRGPAFGYWRVPDAASLALLQAQELEGGGPRRAPRFIVFPTLNTHAPFRPLAPPVDDWARLTTPEAWTADQVAAAEAAPVSWLEATPAYLDAIGAQFALLTDYLGRRAPPHLLTIVIGDHQPLAAVSGRDASWDVPVHVIGDDPALLQRLVARGFRPGLQPPAETLGPMHALTPILLEAFDRPADPPPDAGEAVAGPEPPATPATPAPRVQPAPATAAAPAG